MNFKFNKTFPFLVPFGVLQTSKVFFSITLFIIFICIDKYINGIEIINTLLCFFGIFSLLSLTAHIFGLQHNLSDKTDVFCYIPLALLDFFIGVLAAFIYSIGFILFFISLPELYEYSTKLFFKYFFGGINCLLLMITYGFYSFKLYLKSPNQKTIGIKSIIVEA
ncbi:Hypothetical protein SRAE_1000299700 [Strongyloides ratti]|uniref:MARVEL domain-containing protein n=1 Tax=Strongyloides ratti TaxID=34506 RepID=A0A090MX35_STRRB|nr:Hypothetical protein SRAE_1000299700 [Strongyloides ratti]CEF64744.1 Hypothetical protein SRAE_1000299700 [Strongyloides ratti]